MAHFVVDKFGSEYVYEMAPKRTQDGHWTHIPDTHFVELPKGSIKRLTGKTMKYEDEPIFHCFAIPKTEDCFSFRELFVAIFKKTSKLLSRLC